MRPVFRYFVLFLIFFLLFRFFGIIFSFTIRFWYIVLPVLIYFYFVAKKRLENKYTKRRTGLDPDKEVKLKKEPKIEVEDED
ncbi:MAG: hypothetical protein KAU01_09935 [Candidatus Cloacimonetes bacterium]|nr:hypothetical protein [Candidatus Cloacimonadota bacterium]